MTGPRRIQASLEPRVTIEAGLSTRAARFEISISEMGLVAYSDSEGSADEAEAQVKLSSASQSTRKRPLTTQIDASGARKIKIDLPPVQAEQTPERPVKKPRTNGGLSGFNALLPAPKQKAVPVTQGVKLGVNLRTSSEAAFSRAPVEERYVEPIDPITNASEAAIATTPATSNNVATQSPSAGSSLKFKPLSVMNGKRKSKKPSQSAAPPAQLRQPVNTVEPVPVSKPKASLFSLDHIASLAHTQPTSQDSVYKPLMMDQPGHDHEMLDAPIDIPISTHTQPSNTLTAIASDLNLSASERRRLFGRDADKASDIMIQDFNMDREYANNEELRASGEAVEHRAVRAIAPGKHSLQQLVNAASSQKEALEDAWAQGRRNKAESGASYGFGR